MKKQKTAWDMPLVGIAIGVPIAVVLVAVARVFLPAGLERWAFRRSPQGARAEYREWMTKRLHLPPEAVDAKPFNKATQDAARRFLAEWGKRKDRVKAVLEAHSEKTGPRAGAAKRDFAAIRRDLSELQPLTSAFEALVAQPDYEVDAVVDDRLPDTQIYHVPYPDLTAIVETVKLLLLRSFVLGYEGRTTETFRTAEIVVQASRATPYDYVAVQVCRAWISTVAARIWWAGIAACPDARLLRQALAGRTRFAEQQVLLSGTVPIDRLEAIGTLREIRRSGMEVDLRNLTGTQLEATRWDAHARYLKMILPGRQNDPKQAETIRNDTNRTEEMCAAFGGPCRNRLSYAFRFYGPFIRPFLYDYSREGLDTVLQRAHLASTRLDLLRLETARRIYRLERGQPPARMTDLTASGLLPALPVDHFAKPAAGSPQTYRERPAPREGLSSATLSYYSVGPDGVDQGGTLAYDITNGTISPFSAVCRVG